MSSNIKKNLKAILFTDIKSNLLLAGITGASAVELVREYRRILLDVLAGIPGQWDKSSVESNFLLFDSASEAFRCATILQETLYKYNRKVLLKNPRERIWVKIALHAGEVVLDLESGDIFSEAVNVVQAAEKSGDSGDILLTRHFADLIKDSITVPLTSIGMVRINASEVELLKISYIQTSDVNIQFVKPPKVTFFGRLISSNILQTIAAYLALSWGIVESTDFFVKRTNSDTIILDGVILLLISGLLPSLFYKWRVSEIDDRPIRMQDHLAAVAVFLLVMVLTCLLYRTTAFHVANKPAPTLNSDPLPGKVVPPVEIKSAAGDSRTVDGVEEARYVNENLARAKKLFQSNRLKEARNIYNQIIKRYPDNILAARSLARCEEKMWAEKRKKASTQVRKVNPPEPVPEKTPESIAGPLSIEVDNLSPEAADQKSPEIAVLVLTDESIETVNRGFSLEVNTQTIPEDEPDLVFVEGGSFSMGSEKGNYNEKPVHEVRVDSFYMGKTEVTWKEYASVMNREIQDQMAPDLPVNKISWYDAVRFCNQKSSVEGRTPCYFIHGDKVTCKWNVNGYRLPTEAEWEYAARGGRVGKNYVYSGSNDLDEVSWYEGNSFDCVHAVAKKKCNGLGLYDMTGNLWEWCWDGYGSEYYRKGSSHNPSGEQNSASRVIRGGAWTYGSSERDMRLTLRGRLMPGAKSETVGIRIVTRKK